ncbi:hypothetical protein Taro_051677 [Colocasia esculenta]|uniref:ER lumen protein-retaining receptor n=1 Tax=Colocasia esculenta TaxID=4460 RepID=A0A843XHJ3_COLES|nr:hypothetical protein [Colocasia esculenta]
MNIFRLAGDMTHLMSVIVLLLKIHTIKSCAGISLKTQELFALVFISRYLDIFTEFISLYNTVMKLIFLGSSFSIVWYMRRHRIVNRSYDKEQDTFRHHFLILACLFLALLIHEKFTFKEVMWTFSLYLEAVAILPQLVLLQRTRNIDNLTGQYVFLLGFYLSVECLSLVSVLCLCSSTPLVYPASSSRLYRLSEEGAPPSGMAPPTTPKARPDPCGDFPLGTSQPSIWSRMINRFPGLSHSAGGCSISPILPPPEREGLFCCSAYRGLYIVNWIYRYFTEPHYVHWITWISGLVQTLLYADFFYYYFHSWKNNVKLQLPA